MPVLHLGVIDLPYTGKKRSVTTGDVAGFLENKYHVMEVFAIHNETYIANKLEKSLVGTMESLLMGAPATLDPFGAGASQIEDKFKSFLSTRAVEKVGIAGVPTGAALSGVSRRHKSGFTRGRKRRPSFIDTGLYQSSFKAWVD
jgi:hypothetical protein